MKYLFLLLVSLLSTSAFCETPFSLVSSGLRDGEKMQVDYTCQGKDISPQLAWTGVPDRTKSLVLIVSDRDASQGTFYHWVVYQIPLQTNQFEEDMRNLPQGAMLGANSWNVTNYSGPCPPKGEIHHYTFTLYALDVYLNAKPGMSGDEILTSIQNHIIGTASINVNYGY